MHTFSLIQLDSGDDNEKCIQMKDKDWEVNFSLECTVLSFIFILICDISNIKPNVQLLPHWATGPCIVQGREEELLYFTPRVLIMHRGSGRLHTAASGPRSPHTVPWSPVLRR